MEESPKKLRDVISTAYKLQHGSPLLLGNNYWELRDKVVAHEHIILRTLGFNLNFQHPYIYLLQYTNTLSNLYTFDANLLSKISWNILNDSLWTTLWLEFPPQTVAISCIYLASKLSDIDLEVLLRNYLQKRDGSNSNGDSIVLTPLNFNWWNILNQNITSQDIDTVVRKLLETYRNRVK